MRSSSTATPHVRRIARHLLWLGLAAGHLPALAATLAEGRLISAAVLLVSEVFFLLKLVDLGCLRLPSERRAILAFVAVVILLHAPVLNRATAHADQPLPWHVMVVTGGLAALSSVLVPRRNRPATISPRVLREYAHSALARFESCLLRAWLPARFLMLQVKAPLRSPPACA